MKKFLSSTVVVLAILAGTSSPGLADKLIVRDPQGRITFIVDRTLSGRLVIKKPDGTIVGTVSEPKEEKAPEERKPFLTLPPSWRK